MPTPSPVQQPNRGHQVAPHPLLKDYYPTEDQRQGFITPLFDRTAPDYEWICQMLSFGSGKWHRKNRLRELGLCQGMKLLDVACGPGTVGRCAKTLVGPTGSVIGLDASRGMLQEVKKQGLFQVSQGLAEQLPFQDSLFDFVTMGYALRHVSDLAHTFKEYLRVLKPGGTVLILEISRPHSPMQMSITKFFFKFVVPKLTQWKTGNQDAVTLMRYFWDTIEQCVPPAQITTAIENAGFDQLKVSEIAGGLIRDYSGRKPLGNPPM